MIFTALPLAGAYLIALEIRGDERGFFARAFCQDEFKQHQLITEFVQANDSFSAEPGTLRGLHYQLPPHEEAKLVRCIHGRIHDVIVDLRQDSATFGRWHAMEISSRNRLTLYAPSGCAHGFMTLEPDTEVWYLVSNRYAPHHERGIRWDDPRFAIEWPLTPTVISQKDRSHPDFDPQYHLLSPVTAIGF